MTLDLDRQLRHYGEYLDGVAADLDIDTLEAMWEIEAVPAAPRRLQGWKVAVVVAAALLLLIGGIAVLARVLGEEEPPAVTEPPTSTTVLVPTPDAAPLPGTHVVASGLDFPYVAAAIPADGKPLLGYLDSGSLTVLKCENSECSSTTPIVEAQGHSLRFAVDDRGTLLIGFGIEGPADSSVELRVCADPACSQMTTASIPDANFMDVAIAPDGLPVVLYEITPQGRLEVVVCQDPACSALGDPSEVGPGEDAVIAIGADGLPVIAHAEPRQPGITIVKCGNPTCSAGNQATTFIDNDNIIRPGLEVPVDGLPVLLYTGEHPDTFLSGVQVIKCGDPACADTSRVTVTTAGVDYEGDRFASLATDSRGHPLVNYIVDGDVFVSTCTDPGCLEEIEHRLIASAVWGETAIALGSGDTPQVVASDQESVMLITCADATCSQGQVAIPPEPVPPLEPLESGIWKETPAEVAGFSTAANELEIHATSEGMIAFGHEGECLEEFAPFTCVNTGYISADGLAWEEFEPPPGAFSQVVEGPAGLVVLAVSGEDRTYSVWVSRDGTTWEQTASFEQGISVDELERGHGELVIRGFEQDVGWAYWTSFDGTEWSRVPLEEGMFDPGIPGGWYAEDLIVLPSGYVLLGQIEQPEPYLSTAGAWVTDDLVTWDYLEDPERTRPYPFYTQSTSWSGGIFTAGFDCDEQGFCPEEEAMWVSDGLTWTKTTRDQAVFADVSLWEIQFSAGGPGLIGIGRHHDERSLGPLGIWTSPDGLTWELIDSAEMVDLDLIWVGDRFVAIGPSTSDPERLTSWIWTPGS